MSPRPKTRDLIIETADELFYQNGFDFTSFSDIAKVVDISRGNFYHHFKTKDEILTAVIELRKERTKNALEIWEQDIQEPLERIKQFFSFFTTNRTKIRMYGCPLGTLCNEMAKLQHEAKIGAVEIYALFRTWISQQFESLGCTPNQADHLSLHIISQSQGIANIFTAFQDDAFVEREIARVYAWLDAQTFSQHETKHKV
jgi:AcrR family transcriptional regulator